MWRFIVSTTTSPACFCRPPPHYQDKGLAVLGLREIRVLSRMQGRMAGSCAPLGLLLVCLHLPGTEAVMPLGRRDWRSPRKQELRKGVKAGGYTFRYLREKEE